MRHYPNRPIKQFSSRRRSTKNKRNLLLTIFLLFFLGYALLVWIIPNVIGGLFLVSHIGAKPATTPSPIADSTLAPPVLNIPYEATNTATIRIKGYASPHNDVELYVNDSKVTTTEANEEGVFIAEKIDLETGDNTIYGKTVSDTSTSLPSKPIKVIYSNAKPKLSVSSPTDGQTVKGGDKKITVAGSTDPGDSIVVNGQRVIVNGDGNFSQSIPLNDGDNTVTVTASDQFNNQNQISLKVKYES